MALYTLSGLLLALEGALSLVPGRSGREWRALSDGVYGFLRELQAQPPQEFVSVRCLDRDGRVQVQIRTWGLSFFQEGDFRLERGVPKPRKVFPPLWELLACWVALGAVGMVWGWPMGQVLLGGAVLCLGNLLLRRWEEEMKRQGFSVLLTSTQAQEQSQHFYRHFGYRDVGGFLLPPEPYELILAKNI